MERRLAVHVLDKLTEMGLLKQNQVNNTVITFVQEQIQQCLSGSTQQIVTNDFVSRHKGDRCS